SEGADRDGSQYAKLNPPVTTQKDREQAIQVCIPNLRQSFKCDDPHGQMRATEGVSIFQSRQAGKNLCNIEFISQGVGNEKFNCAALVQLLRAAFRHIDLSNTQLLLVPILHRQHWSLYGINFVHSRIDIMDSNDYDLIGTLPGKHHSELARRRTIRLSDAPYRAAPGKFKRFGNYRKSYLDCPKMALPSNDCAFYVMKYMEVYDGNKAPLETLVIPDDSSVVLRSQILHHLILHRFNTAHPLPPELDQSRLANDIPTAAGTDA
ncbi:hypothetical protein E2562_038372, partial [Oryza meyeriana var. granulata]